jgi:integrase
MIPAGDYWHTRYQLDGKRVQRTTREPLRNRAKAERLALEMYESAKLRSRGEEPEPTLAEAVKGWVQAHLLRKSTSHIACVERFGKQLGSLADLKLTQLTTGRVEEELNAYLATHRPSTGNQWLTYLRLVCKWAVRRRMIRAVPFDVDETRVKSKPKPLLPTHRVLDLLDRADRICRKDPALGLVLRLQIGLGLRPGEARKARWEWLDWDRGTYTPGDTKGGEAVARPMPPWLVADLKPLAKTFGWIVPSTRNGQPVSAARLARLLHHACRDLELPRLTPHCLRHTYATWLSEEGLPIQDIQLVLGHKDVKTTSGYLGFDLSRVKSAQARVAQRTGLAGRESGRQPQATRRGVSV